MQKRVFEYGARLNALVTNIVTRGKSTGVILVDETGEGHVLLNVPHSIEPAVDMRVLMEFTSVPNRPGRGYWRIIEKIEGEGDGV